MKVSDVVCQYQIVDPGQKHLTGSVTRKDLIPPCINPAVNGQDFGIGNGNNSPLFRLAGDIGPDGQVSINSPGDRRSIKNPFLRANGDYRRHNGMLRSFRPVGSGIYFWDSKILIGPRLSCFAPNLLLPKGEL